MNAAKKINDTNLEGKIVLIAQDSEDSRILAQQIHDNMRQDHTYGNDVIILNSKNVVFGNGKQTCRLYDPKNKYSLNEIPKICKNSFNIVVSRLENPFLRDPLRYAIEPILEKLGTKYANLVEAGKEQKKFRDRFINTVAITLPSQLKGVINKNKLENSLTDIAEEIQEVFKDYEDTIKFKYSNQHGNPLKKEITYHTKKLNRIKRSVRKYFEDEGLIKKRDQQNIIDETMAILHDIGTRYIKKDSKGKLGLLAPFIDGRSDKTEKDEPTEAVNFKKFTDDLKNYNTTEVHCIRLHSQNNLDDFKRCGINVTNLTFTNEYISLKLNNDQIDLEKLMGLSPDFGGLADTMVYARDMYKRTKGDFPGYVLVCEKQRGRGIIKKMEIRALYKYNETSESQKITLDKDGHPIPYDIEFSKTFKIGHFNEDYKWKNVSNKPKVHDEFIGNKYDLILELPPKVDGKSTEEIDEKLKELQDIVGGFTSDMRDDIIGSGATVSKSAYEVWNNLYSPVILDIEIASLPNGAVSVLDDLAKEGILIEANFSGAVQHEDLKGKSYANIRPSSQRFTKNILKNYKTWLKNNFKEKFNRLQKYKITTENSIQYKN